MKKISVIVIIFLLSVLSFHTDAQPYIVPGAQIQPAWVFPLWFESGDGKKDTCYLVYDPNIDSNDFAFDTIFGIKPSCQDNDSFYVSLGGYVPCDSNGTQQYSVNYTPCALVINHAKYPFKIKWNKQLLYDTILPFPNILPYPIIRIWGYWAHPYNPPLGGTFESHIIADTAGLVCNPPGTLTFFDSAVFDGPLSDIVVNGGGNGPALSFHLTSQATPCIGGGVEELNGNAEIIYYPNPCTERCFIENRSPRSLVIRLTNGLGQCLNEIKLSVGDQYLLDSSQLPIGVYQLQTSNMQFVNTHKIIKL